jgi:ribosome maturation factor RimP
VVNFSLQFNKEIYQMALTDSIAELIEPAVSAQGYFLEEVQLVSPGKHRIITCIVDGQTPLNLDQVTSVSRAISELLDESPIMGDTPFTLEVTSPGIDRPLTKPRHFAKNNDRLLKVTKTDGDVVTGRILSNTDTDVTLSVTVKKEISEIVIDFVDIKRAVVEIEFNRKDGK